MSKISIIIPIYNVEAYLPQCLDSVIHQTYQDLEIILVNDGSTDACPQICETYAAKDKRIILIHKENGGLSDARNAGINICNGDFISFVDSDDIMSLDFYQLLMEALVKNDADIAECSFSTFEDGEDIVLEPNSNPVAEFYNTECALNAIFEEKLSIVVWNKIYKKELFYHIIFPVNKINEDVYTTYKVFAKAKKIVKTSDVLYFYRNHGGSIMGRDYSLKRLDGLAANEEMMHYFEKYFPNLHNRSVKAFCFVAMGHYIKISENLHLDPQKISRKKITSQVKLYNKFSILKHWRLKDIFWYQLFIFSPALYLKLKNYNEARIQKRDAVRQ